MSLSQNTSRIAKLIRELANTRIFIQEMKIVGARNFQSKYFRKKEEKLKIKEEKKSLKLQKKYGEEERVIYLKNNNEFKEKMFVFLQKQKQLFASSFVKYTIKLTHNNSDSNMFLENLPTKELYFPLSWVFGVYLKTEYSEFDEFLETLSNKDEYSYKVLDSFYEDSQNKIDDFNKLIEVPLTKEEIREAKKEKAKAEKEKAIKDHIKEV